MLCLGSIWKAITGNQDSKNYDYFDKIINEVEQNEKQLKILIKNKIAVTPSIITYTIWKLQIDKEIFSQNLRTIGNTITNISKC